MHEKSTHHRQYLVLVLCFMALHAGHTGAEPHTDAGSAQAAQQVRQAILASLTPAQAQHIHIEVQLAAPRGAAQQPCAQGWTWGAIDPSYWQRVHLPVECGTARGSWAAQVQVSGPVWVAAADLPAGRPLQGPDWQPQTGRVYQASDLLSRDDWMHLHLRRDAPQGHVLRLRDLERPIYARKGDVIEIQATEGGITVSTQGMLTQTARKGDAVRVRNVHSQHWVNGTMVAPKVMQAAPERAGGVKVEVESLD